MLPTKLLRLLIAAAFALLHTPSHSARGFSCNWSISPRKLPSTTQLTRGASRTSRALRASISVYNNVVSPGACQKLHELTLESTQRGTDGSFVFRRGQNRRLTPIETTIDQILTALNDTSPIVEYWSRSKYINLDAHADIDENALKEDGILRCPRNGHVLYMQVANNTDNEMDGRVGPTVVFPDRRVAWGTVTPRTTPSPSSASYNSHANLEERVMEYIVDVENYWDDEQRRQYGYDKEQTAMKEEMAIVPAVTGRLLRFDGAAFHAVPKPPDRYLLNEKEVAAFLEKECEEDCDDEDGWDDDFGEYDDEDVEEEEEDNTNRRSVLLFNTWPEGSNGPRGVNTDTVVHEVPDGIVLDDGDAIDDSSLEEERWQQWQEEYGEAFEEVRCNSFEEWHPVAIDRPPTDATRDVIVPLMGNPARRGCQSNRDVLKGAIDSDSFYDGQRSAGSIEVQATFVVKKSKNEVAAYYSIGSKTYEPQGAQKGNWGPSNFAKRSTLIEDLVDGALVIEVQMKQTGPSTLTAPFVPANPFCQNALKKFMDEESADVVFEDNAPALAEACKMKDDLAPIPISGVDPAIFRHVLYYAYGGQVSDEDMEANAKDIIEVADKLGVANLKLEAEACFVKGAGINTDNVMENLIFADAKNCPLLKEAVMDFLVENGTEVVRKVDLKDAPGGLLADILTAVNQGKRKDGGSGDDLSIMRVSELRRKLAAKGLEVDGSREAMMGAYNFAQRSTLIEALEDGALVIEGQLTHTGASTTAPFVPENPCSKNTLSKFLDEESADVVFEVSTDHVGGERRRTRKRAGQAPTTFCAHRFVLPKSGALAEACESNHDLTPIPINGVVPSIFRHLLYYLYGGTVDDDVLKEKAKEIIEAADKFGVVGLKLEAEAAFVSSTDITIDNFMDNLLYAYAKNLALLQEAVMDFCVENGDEVSEKLSFDGVPGTFVADLLKAKIRGAKEGEASNLRTARVSTLRKMLHEKGLDVDGSREAMIARLNEHSSN